MIGRLFYTKWVTTISARYWTKDRQVSECGNVGIQKKIDRIRAMWVICDCTSSKVNPSQLNRLR
jgi:hypothetical protein